MQPDETACGKTSTNVDGERSKEIPVPDRQTVTHGNGIERYKINRGACRRWNSVSETETESLLYGIPLGHRPSFGGSTVSFQRAR